MKTLHRNMIINNLDMYQAILNSIAAKMYQLKHVLLSDDVKTMTYIGILNKIYNDTRFQDIIETEITLKLNHNNELERI